MDSIRNPRPAYLVAAAQAVEIDPESLFEILGKDAPKGVEKSAAGGFTVRFNQLTNRDQYTVIQLVESMLATREYIMKDDPQYGLLTSTTASYSVQMRRNNLTTGDDRGNESDSIEEWDDEPPMVELHAFGHFFNKYPSGLAEDLVTLEREGATYAHFADRAKGPDEEGRSDFDYYRIKFQPTEIVQYVEASVAHQQFLEFDGTFDEALNALADQAIAERVRSYGISLLKDGTYEDLRGCFASFLPAGMEELVCGGLPGRYERMRRVYRDGDGFAELMQILNNFLTATRAITDRKYGRPPFIIENEYDVQDLLFTIVRSIFEDAKREEWTPQKAGSSKRIDLVISSIQTVIEVKFVRDNAHARKVADELKIDFESYHERGECSQLVAFVIDPDRRISDPEQFSLDLSGLRQKRDHSFNVSVLVR